MLISARQLADTLGITAQMLSKYVQAYTKLTKQQIMKQGRNGRHFNAQQVEVIKNARDMVRSNTGVTVDDAMKRALMFDPVPAAVELGTPGAPVDLAQLDGLLRAALRDEVTTPLIAEMQVLRTEIAELRHEAIGKGPANTRPVVFGAEEWATDPLDAPRQVESPADDRPHSLFIRMALRIESWLRR